MAAEGVRFENAFTPQPVCGPARACLQTGRYATEIGCHTNGRRLPQDEPTIAHGLSAAGYEAGYIGKWHLASNRSDDTNEHFRTRAVPPERRGGYEDYWLAADVLEFTSHSYDGHMFNADGSRREFPAGRYRVDVLTDWAIEHLQSRNGGRPFFLFVSYIEPHFQNDHACFEGPTGSKERFKDFVPPATSSAPAATGGRNIPITSAAARVSTRASAATAPRSNGWASRTTPSSSTPATTPATSARGTASTNARATTPPSACPWSWSAPVSQAAGWCARW